MAGRGERVRASMKKYHEGDFCGDGIDPYLDFGDGYTSTHIG